MRGFKPNYNVAPSQTMPVETKDGIQEMRWGLVPSWSKTFSTSFSTINARAEGIEQSKLYSRLLKSHRCIIPATSYFEWASTGAAKQPYLFRLKTKDLFYFAGLWSSWHDDKDKEFKSYTIITTRPNQLQSRVHDRMPVLLEPDEVKPWLEEEDHIDFKQVLDPYPASKMEMYPVSSLVNKPANNFPEILQKFNS